ncbi:MAG: tRNA (adenosine(37)-N6)-threonylcarbamoyltransferase complex ATPase subunit type 1 TsaE [Actinomycetota bacterium]|nr:tRNA (adenosine(37)-N6)-threonylcarbamoyltransferase complex ATPase subunit type 1 TsaE [Actinomycetota bacterium]
MPNSLTVVTLSAEETRILGASLAPTLLPGDVLSLAGDLGAGKTTFAQGLGGGLGVQHRITSPTFTLVNEYDGRYPVIHVDVYRLDSIQEVLDLGFEELLDPGAILLVEWGEAVLPLLPRRYLEVDIRRSPDVEADDQRVISFRPRGPEWAHKLAEMRVTAEALMDALAPEGAPPNRFVEVPEPRDDSDPRSQAGDG